MPSYDFLAYVVGSFLCVVLMDRYHPQVSILPTVALWIIYGSSAGPAGLMAAWFCGFLGGTLATVMRL